MNLSRVGPTATAALAVIALTACGARDQSSGEPQGDPATERITAQGVAALVDEHLGAQNVKQYGTYGEEEESSVDVMVQMRGDDRRNMFVVGVTSPEGAEQEFAMARKVTCEQLERRGGRRGGRVWCEELESGGVATVQLAPYGFSDNNRQGRVLSGFAAGNDGRLATAMYETYTATVSVDPDDLLALIADERLAWSTDPAVNDAGQDIEVRRLTGS